MYGIDYEMQKYVTAAPEKYQQWKRNENNDRNKRIAKPMTDREGRRKENNGIIINENKQQRKYEMSIQWNEILKGENERLIESS